MDQIVRVGVISDSPLQQHLLQSVISEVGYDVAINIHPQKLNTAILQSETISMWVVDIMDDQFSEQFLDAHVDMTLAPLFFGEGTSPDRQSDAFVGWRRRLITKLSELAPPIQTKTAAPVVDFDDIVAIPHAPEVLALPSNLQNRSPAGIDQIWIVAASLGGPQPVKTFFDCLPRETPAAFLYAQHIDPGCFDSLVKSIGRHTRLSMVEAVQGGQLENGTILVVPVDHEMAYGANHRVQLKDNGWSGPYGPSIDHLVQNTVERYGKRTNLIIFSGMGSDGTIGATLIQQAGGQVWSQSTESAIQPSMPDSAQEAGCVTYRGAPENLARQLLQYLSAHAPLNAASTAIGT